MIMKYHKTFLPQPPLNNLQLGTISMNLSDTDIVFINDVVAEVLFFVFTPLFLLAFKIALSIAI